MPEHEIIETRQSLLSRLKDPSNEESWRLFFDTYWRLIYRTALAAGLNDQEAQEVVQETVLCVSKKIPGFDYDPAVGSFKGWLLQLTRWRISDQRRKRRNRETSLSKPERLREVEQSSSHNSLDRFWDQQWERSVLDAAMEQVKTRVDPKDFQIFDLYVRQSCTVRDVSKRLKVSAAKIYMVKHRVGALVKKRVTALKKETFS